MTAPDPVNLWHETDRQIAISNHYDRRVARDMNAEFELLNAEPFGSLRSDP